MDTDELFKYLAGENNIEQVIQSEAQLDEAQPDGVTITDLIPSLSSMSFVMAWAMILLMLSKVWGSVWFVTVKRIPEKIPCRRCQFFSSNPHLPCAVNPSIVLSEAAMNCSDYLPKSNKFSH